jgi:hypothetical protein
MRYSIGSVVLLTIIITHFASASWPTTLRDGNFFLYNRRSKPIYYALSVGDVEPAQFIRINAQRCSSYISVGLEKEVHMYIALDQEPQVGDMIDHYIFAPGTFRFIHLKVTQNQCDWQNSWCTNGAKEFVRDDYVAWMHTNYNPTIVTTRKPQQAKEDQPKIERVTYNGSKKRNHFDRLKTMTLDQLEERLSTIATLLGVLHARKNEDSEVACKQLEQERACIRNLLAHYYQK